MTSEEKSGSLADQAAAWVPPWARETVPTEPQPGTGTADRTEDLDEEGSSAEPAPVETSGAEPDRAGEASDLGQPGDSAEGPSEGPSEGPEQGPAAGPPEGAAEPPAGMAAVAAVDTPVERPSGGHRDDRLALLDEAELHGALEAILLVVDEPATEEVLAQVLEQPADRIRVALRALARDYTEAGRGFELRRAAGGWRLYTRPEYASYVERFILDGQSVRLTQAALETLAVVAYKQPVTRSRISAIRGVNCDGVIRTLLTRGLVQECGAEPESGAYLYQTTSLFLEKLGIDSVDELPPLAPFLPDNVEEIADAPR